MDLRAGVVASTVANSVRSAKRRSKAFSPDDFFPSLKPAAPKRQTSWESQLAMVEMLNAAFGGVDMRSTN